MRPVLLILFTCLVTMGCNADPRGRREAALLRAEILDLEDKYYLLKSEYADAMAELNSCRGVSHSGEVIIGDGDIIYETPSNSQSIAPGSPPGYSPNGTSNGLQLNIQDPGSNRPPERLPEQLPDQTMNRLPAFPSSTARGSRSQSGSTITRIVINRQRSGGQDVDGTPGDEGINLLVQPLSRTGIPVLAAGDLTVRITDPLTGSANQEIGVWKFLPEETELFFTGPQEQAAGILLHLPWDQKIPSGDQIRVTVEYRDSRPTPLKATARFSIKPPNTAYSPDDPLIAGWSRRDNRWSPGTNSQPKSRVQAIPASSGANRFQKPRWRPVR